MLALLALIPCILWLVSAALALRSITSIPQLTDLRPADPAQWPALSVIVPACNEAATLPAAAEKLLATDYPALEVVFVDDRSTDGTSAVVDDLTARDERIRAVHITALPDGWLGKPHAMQRGLDVASGDWLLFTDADVHFAPRTLRRAVAWCEAEAVDHLTLIPDVDAKGFALQATVASFGRYFSLSQKLWKVNDDDSDASLGVGAFNLVRRSALQRTAGLPWLALEVMDDLALGMMMKRSGARSRVLWGRDALAVHWYPTLSEMIVGLEKNSYPMAGCRLWPLALAAMSLLIIDWTPFAILLQPGLPPWLTTAALVTLAVCLPLGAALARWARRPIAPALAVPLGSTLMAYILLRSGIVGALRGGIHWRGTFYPSALLRRGARVTMFSTVLILSLLFALPLACGQPEVPLPATRDKPFSVYTVNYPLAYFAERIGAGDIEVVFPAPRDIDPAFWQPPPDIVAGYQSADLLLLNGAGYARWVSTAPLPRTRQLDASADPPLPLIVLDDSVSHSHGTGGEHSHGEWAITTWLDLELAARQVRAVADALAEALPSRADVLRTRTASLLGDLAALDEKLLALDDAPPMLASHPVYQYLARRYALDLRSLHWEPGLVPDAEQWATLDALLAERPARWMLWEAKPLPAVAADLQRRGVAVVVFEPCANRPAVGDLLEVMAHNVTAISLAFED